jgi:hypothetical protein
VIWYVLWLIWCIAPFWYVVQSGNPVPHNRQLELCAVMLRHIVGIQITERQNIDIQKGM